MKGYKTYLLTTALFVLGGLSALGLDVPKEVFIMLGAAGAFSLRAAI